MQNVCRAFYAFPARHPSSCPRRHRLVCKGFCTCRALSLRMSLVTAYMSCAFCTTAERDYDDEGVWDADKNNTSDLDVYTRFFEGEGEGWSDLDEARGRQLSRPLFFHTHRHAAPSLSHHALT